MGRTAPIFLQHEKGGNHESRIFRADHEFQISHASCEVRAELIFSPGGQVWVFKPDR